MNVITLVEGEFRSLLRNGAEKILGPMTQRRKNPKLIIINSIAVRVVSSLIVLYFWQFIGRNKELRRYVSIFFVLLFIGLNFTDFFDKYDTE